MIRGARLSRAMARALASSGLPASIDPYRQKMLKPIVRVVKDPLRCRCPECLQLDLLHPGEGYQLALFPYVIQRGPSA